MTLQSLVPRLVRTWVTLVEKRPYSAANGFDSTSTDSTAPLGSSRSKSPVDGSLRLALLICSAPVVGAPPLTRSRPSGPRMMLGSTVSSDWKSSPASGWMSILAPLSTSLTATGCRLSVGELVGAITSTLSRMKVRRISIRTFSTASPRTPNGSDSPSANPSRTARTV